MPFGRGKKKKAVIDASVPDGPGQRTVPNPGELQPDWEEQGIPANSLGATRPRSPRASSSGIPDNAGARVAYLRNLEFSAGGRSQLVGTGTASPAQPHLSPTTGQVQVSSATEEASAGVAHQGSTEGGDRVRQRGEPAQAGQPFGQNADTAEGDQSGNRRGPSN